MNGIAGLHVHTVVSTTSSSSTKVVSTDCNSNGHTGEIATGGGAETGGDNSDVAIQTSSPVGGSLTSPPTGWVAVAEELDPNSGSWNLTLRVICAMASGP